MSDLDDAINDFLAESRENLDRLDQDLIALEKAPNDRERLASVFRTIHTIKGVCGFLGFERLGSLTHVGESLLSRLREGGIPLTPAIACGLLALVDAVRASLERIERTGQEGPDEHLALKQLLTRLQRASIASTATVSLEPTQPSPDAAPDEAWAEGLSEGTVRVDVGLLDRLMNLVGELVLSRNQILQHTPSRGDPALQHASQRLNRITTELQEGVMKTRMQPVGTVWRRLPRIVRDLALTCGKRVRLELEGAETELDRTLVEAVKGPLTHLVRNAIDHGIEPETVRRAAGKPQEGCLRLRAFHEGGQVNLVITDDGAGIDPERVRQKALAAGLLTVEQAARMTPREVLELIFLPGFSTAGRVTAVSGRGVGMDVVRTGIEQIGGTVDVHSQLGEGTSVRLKIPLTLAIIPALIIRSGGDRYAIPQASLLELVRLEGGFARSGIEWVHDLPVYRLRGKLLPLVDLARELVAEVGPRADDEAVNLVVLQVDGQSFGVIVDAINDTEEIVVKPLGRLLNGLALFAGATIMGDGRVALILDVPGLARSAGLLSETRMRAATTATPEVRTNTRTLLVFTAGGQRSAVPLTDVARLEEVPTAKVETAGGAEVIQYRGQILPLLRLGGCPGNDSGTEVLQMIVHSGAGRNVGLIVDRIVDVVEAPAEVEHPGRRRGCVGSTVVQGRVTDLLDVPALLQASGMYFPDSAGAL